MRRLLSAVSYLLLCFSVQAQKQESISVKAGEDYAQAFSPNGFYRYPQFVEGIFTMKDGKKATTKVNYNFLSGQMQYIGQKGDTLSLTIPEKVAVVTIGDNRFVYDKNYLEILSDHDTIKLARRVQVRVRTEKKGGYGQSAPSASIDNYENIVTSSGVYSLKVNQDVIITKTTTFFWLDQQNNSLPATKKNITKLVTTSGKARVEEYINQNNIDFNREQSLLQLLEYAAGAGK